MCILLHSQLILRVNYQPIQTLASCSHHAFHVHKTCILELASNFQLEQSLTTAFDILCRRLTEPLAAQAVQCLKQAFKQTSAAPIGPFNVCAAAKEDSQSKVDASPPKVSLGSVHSLWAFGYPNQGLYFSSYII